ncbi:MAG: sirohydrochlorin chelatase [Puniceicoccaceae bacterium]
MTGRAESSPPRRSDDEPVFLLTDNGSVRPASALALREAAADLARRTGETVEAVSLAHCDRIDPADLGGTPAPTLLDRLTGPEQHSRRPFVVLPFFLGNRGAIVRMVEARIEKARSIRPAVSVRLAPFLFEEDGPEQEVLALAAADRIRDRIAEGSLARPVVVLVDHGSPVPVAARVRNFVAGQVQAILRDEVHCVIPASMERRAGGRYAFSDPLLEEVLRRPALRERPVVLSLFFLLPGRHAGEGGDVAAIRDEAVAEAGPPTLRISTTGLLGDHPLVREALCRRIRRESAPVLTSRKGFSKIARACLP